MGKPLATPLSTGLEAGARPLPLVPRSMEEALTLAKAVVAARMAPRGMETPEACLIAILHGLEVGLTPLSALQRIAVIDGRPTLWGDGAMALVRASGLCRSIREWIEGDAPQHWIASCEVWRKGESEPVTCRFGVADAQRAGLWGQRGPWSSFPGRMLQMRARAFALRDVFADVLGGLYLREEIDSEAVLDAPARSSPDSGPSVALPPAPATPVQRSAAPASHQPHGVAALALEDRQGTGPADQAVSSPPDEVAPQPLAPAVEPKEPSAPKLPDPLPRPRPRRALRRRETQGWVRLRAPKEAIRLRAPAPPEYAVFEAGETEAASRTSRFDIPPGTSLSPAELLDLYDQALACGRDEATLLEIGEEFAPRLARLSRQDLAQAERIQARHQERVANPDRKKAP